MATAALAGLQIEDSAPIPTPFPARSKTKTSSILDITTVATALHFSDKILITISQHGRLAHWIHVPITPSTTGDMHSSIPTDPSNPLLPDTHITATTILGGTIPGLDTLGQTLATHLASAISGASEGREGRMLVLGLGLDRKMERVNPEQFADLVGLALDVL